MIIPFSETLPPLFWASGYIISGVLLFSLLPESQGRINEIFSSLNSLSILFPNWFILQESGTTLLISSLLTWTSLSLLPFGLSAFHYPALGVGISISLWITIIIISSNERLPQLFNEYFNDPSLTSSWATLCVIIESSSRLVRAVTLGGRISVNIIIGSILYSVIGEVNSSWGLFLLCLFESLVVCVQTYVLILLSCFYTAEAA